MSAPLLEARGLRVTGPSGPIVTGMDLAVRHGETVAIVGESGSGKSMTVKALSGLLPRGVHADGEVLLDGKAVTDWRPVLGSRIALLMQDPFTSLSPVHTCGDQIGWAVADRRGRAARVASLLREVGLSPEAAKKYPFELSGGMRQRVAIAAGLAADPDLLIADEPTTALDVTTQHEVLELMAELQRSRKMGLILITHDLRLARARADRVLVMYAGRLVESGSTAQVLHSALHPYTARLAECDPPLDERLPVLATIPGSVPPPYSITVGCPFADRCDLAVDSCRTETPVLVEAAEGHLVACPRTTGEGLPPTVPAQVAEPVAATGPVGEPVLVVSGLTRTFRGSPRPALDGVNLTLGRGASVAIVGESGSGKTTLARCMVGLEIPDSGTVYFGGASGPRRVQIVFQDPYSALNPGLTVGTSLAEALAAAGRSRAEVPELLKLVGLPEAYAKRRPRALSGGERQRVAIARALAPRAEILICDESVSALDVSVQAGVLNLLAGLRRELDLTLLFITHDLAIARQVADEVHVMYQGRVVESGTADAVLSNPGHDYTRRLLASVPSDD